MGEVWGSQVLPGDFSWQGMRDQQGERRGDEEREGETERERGEEGALGHEAATFYCERMSLISCSCEPNYCGAVGSRPQAGAGGTRDALRGSTHAHGRARSLISGVWMTGLYSCIPEIRRRNAHVAIVLSWWCNSVLCGKEMW